MNTTEELEIENEKLRTENKQLCKQVRILTGITRSLQRIKSEIESELFQQQILNFTVRSKIL